jgi:hypothetical protein
MFEYSPYLRPPVATNNQDLTGYIRVRNDRLTLLGYHCQQTAAVWASHGASYDGGSERVASIFHFPASVEGEQTWW